MGSLIVSWNRGDGPRTGFYTDDEVNGVYFLRVNNLKEHSIDLLDVKYIHREVHEKTLQRTKVTRGDVIFAISGTKDNLGTVSIIPDFIQEANLNSALVRLDLDTNKVNKDFFCYFFDLNVARRQIQFIGKGAAQNNLNNEEISQIKIPLPPLEIQILLVAEIEAARQTRKQKLAQADELLSRLDVYLLDQLGLNIPGEIDRQVFAIRLDQIKSRLDSHSNQPRFRKLIQLLQSHRFPVLKLSSLATDIFSGTTPKSGGDAYTDNKLEGIPFIRSGEITKDGRVTEDNAIFIKPKIHQGLMRRSQLQQGDLLIAIVGATIGSVGVYNLPTSANINQAIAAVRLDNSRVLPDFVRWFLSSPIGQAILDYLKRPVARANINLEEIGEILILIPPLEIQCSVIEQVDHTRLTMKRLRQEAETEWEAAKTRFERKLLGEEA
ncbi:restriction endonuclease subunit S [Nostoc sp. C117]|uniref:restriction endonuclease subunit S n=1 Tax=Nostoc sp. C117 TaxID=3349875 RepID=UPI00370DB9E9